MSVVLDASVVIAVIVADERQDAARAHLFIPARDGDEVAAVTARLRRRHATDSAYISLAHRLQTAVWTLDGRLARNAADVGLPVRLVS